MKLIYDIDDKSKSTRDWIVYSLQWVITMVYAVVWGYAIVGIEMNFNPAELSSFMSSIILTIGLSTLLQAWLGHRMAMVSGANIIPSLAIVAAITAGGTEYAKEAFLAQSFASVIIILFSFMGIIKYIKKIWSPLILGSMVMMVGISISRQGLNLLADTGFDIPFLIGISLALGGIFIAIKGKGIIGTLAPLIIVVTGYIVFMFMGDFQWNLLTEAELFVLPKFLPYGFKIPSWDLIFIMVVVNLMSVLNWYGNIDGYSKIIEHEVSDKKMKHSLWILGGAEMFLTGLFGVPATVSYGENLGIITLTRVAARCFIIPACIIFIALAFIGPVGGLMAAMPHPVAGAILLGIASTVIGIGASMMNGAKKFERREQSIVSFSIFLSLGLFLLPKDVWNNLPRIITTIFSNPIISVIIFVMIFEQLIFRSKATNNSQGEDYGKK